MFCELMGIFLSRRFLRLPTTCDFCRQIGIVTTDNGFFLVHWFIHVFLGAHGNCLVAMVPLSTHNM